MAFLWKHPKSQYWIARFYDKNGKRRNRSTSVEAKEANRRKAQKIADSYEEVAKKRRTSTQVRKTISSLHKEITGESLTNQTFAEFSGSWLAKKKVETSLATRRFYEGVIKKFNAFLGEKTNNPIVDIQKQDIETFRNMEAQDLAPKTVNHDVKVLKMLFKAARQEEVIAEDPTEFVDTIRQSGGSQRRPFTVKELQAVLAVADDEWKSMILFGVYTGQRLGDIASLTWSNIDLQRNEIRLVTHKTSKRMILPIAAPLKKHLEALPAGDTPDAPLHPRAFATYTRHQGSGSLSTQFADLLAQAGLREKTPHRKTLGKGRGVGSSRTGLSFHCLRHSAVSWLKDAGIPVSVVMEFVGHDSEQMSALYTHVGDDALRKAADALPDIFQKK